MCHCESFQKDKIELSEGRGRATGWVMGGKRGLGPGEDWEEDDQFYIRQVTSTDGLMVLLKGFSDGLLLAMLRSCSKPDQTAHTSS